MKTLRYLLVTDGRSDQSLIYVLNWLLHRHLPNTAINGDWSDPAQLPRGAVGQLHDRIRESLLRYPQSDLLCIHRDAESQSRAQRVEEIHKAIHDIKTKPIVCVIPVRMTEAWLLFDEQAIRTAAGNPNGSYPLQLPPSNQVESIPDPKTTLYEFLKKASGLSVRRLKKFRPQVAAHRVAELIDDFSVLNQLPAFQALDADLDKNLSAHGWK